MKMKIGQKLFKFLSFVNQSDWLAKQLIKLAEVLDNNIAVDEIIKESERDFLKKNIEHRLKEKILYQIAILKFLKI